MYQLPCPQCPNVRSVSTPKYDKALRTTVFWGPECTERSTVYHVLLYAQIYQNLCHRILLVKSPDSGNISGYLFYIHRSIKGIVTLRLTHHWPPLKIAGQLVRTNLH